MLQELPSDSEDSPPPMAPPPLPADYSGGGTASTGAGSSNANLGWNMPSAATTAAAPASQPQTSGCSEILYNPSIPYTKFTHRYGRR